MFGPLSSPPQSLYSNSFSGALPTQIGQLTQMKSDMVSQGPSTDNDRHTDNIDKSSSQSHGATHLIHHHHRVLPTHTPQSCALLFIVSPMINTLL